jgi:hydrogenase-4 component B
MLGPMAALAAVCIVIGVLPFLALPILDRANQAWMGPAPLPALAVLAPAWWISGMALVLWSAAAIGVFALRSRAGAALAQRTLTRDCGYAAPSARMQYTSSSFAQFLINLFAFVLRPVEHRPRILGPFPARARSAGPIGDVVMDSWVMPLLHRIAGAALHLRVLQRGRIQMYLLYVLGALLALILSILPLLDLVRSVISR